MSNENEVKKSKYFRDGTEPKSKYFRKYEKPEEEEPEVEELEEGEYRRIVLTPKRAKEMLLAEEEAARSEGESAEDTELSDYETKGSLEEVFDTEKEEEERPKRRASEGSLKFAKSQALIRMIVCCGFLTLIAVCLNLIYVHIPYTPSILIMDFSAIPELIASIAYGPIVGVMICLIKNVIHMMMHHRDVVSDLNNMLSNSTFVFIAGLLYSRSMFAGDRNVVQPKNYKKKDYRRRRILKSGILGALISMVPQFFITNYITYPLLERLYAERGVTIAALLTDYQSCYARVLRHLPAGLGSLMPQMTDMARGVLFINLPLAFTKLFVITVITAIIYKWISPFLHYRENKKKK
ncbi:MAG: ECF transporter S component [Eubacterium sp.]|nr:ECF transporter S component [Eubacterium sp.]